MKKKHPYDNDFTMISNRIMTDKRLGFKEVGMFIRLWMLPDDWRFSIEGIIARFGGSRDGVSSALRKLETCGYLTRKPVFDRGRLCRYEYFLDDSPAENDGVLKNSIPENSILKNSILKNRDNKVLCNKVLNDKEKKNKVLASCPLRKGGIRGDDVRHVSSKGRNLQEARSEFDFWTLEKMKSEMNRLGVRINHHEIFESRFNEIRDAGWKSNGRSIRDVVAFMKSVARRTPMSQAVKAEVAEAEEMKRRVGDLEDAYAAAGI